MSYNPGAHVFSTTNLGMKIKSSRKKTEKSQNLESEFRFSEPRKHTQTARISGNRYSTDNDTEGSNGVASSIVRAPSWRQAEIMACIFDNDLPK